MIPKYFFFILFLLFQISAMAQHTPWRTGEMEIKVTFTSPEQAQIIGALGLNGDIFKDHAWLYLTPDELPRLKNSGISYTITKPDLNKWSADFGGNKVPSGYYSFDEIKDIADSLATHYPSICKKVVYGFTPDLKELAALKISDNVNVDEDEAEVLLDGGIHGDEVGGSQNMIQFARDLCRAYGSDSYITNLVNHREIWIYYCVNPFGRDYMTRYNSNGVDLNRDFGYAWGYEGSSTSPFSQPETKALRDCQYSNQFVTYTNFHSGAQNISFPWSYRYSPTPDNTQIEALANIYSVNSGYSSLPYGQGSQIMYLIQGSTKDYNYACQGSVTWSIEMSLDKQPAGPNIQYYYTINKSAMLAIIEHSGYGIEGTVTDAVTGVPVKAQVWVGSNYPTFTDGDAGDYHKYLVPGTYDLRFTANGYQSKLVNNVAVEALKSTITNVQLQPIQSQFGYKTCMMHIPGFNPQDPGDEGYTAACLGAPDQVNYSLGKGGYIMIDMQYPVKDESGNDIKVYEGDASPESYSVYALANMDAEWKLIGSAVGTNWFDLVASGLSEVRFFVIKDDDNGTANMNDAGFDLDAIENIHAPVPDTLAHLSGKVYNFNTGLLLAGAIITSGDSTVITDLSGFYSIDLVRGSKKICASFPNFNSECDTLQLAPATETSQDFYLNYNEELQAINPAEPILISPNPFKEILNINFSTTQSGRVKINLISITGGENVVLKDEFFVSGKHSFVTNPSRIAGYKLTPGVYMLNIETTTSKQEFKVIKVSEK